MRAAPALLSVLLFAACGSSAPGPSDAGGDGGPDGGLRCTGSLSGLSVLPDGGAVAQIPLDDAGFDCVALLLVDGAGTRTTLSLAPDGPLPPGVTALSAVLVLAGGAPLTVGDAGFAADLGGMVQASASVTLRDGLAFGMQKGTGPTRGASRLVLTEVSDAGTPAAEGRQHEAHGTLDATLPWLFGPRPDGGTFDAGTQVLLHAQF